MESIARTRRPWVSNARTAVVAACAILTLTACGGAPSPTPTPAPSASTASTASQCERVTADITALGTELTEVVTMLGNGDVLGVLGRIPGIQQRVDNLGTGVSDPELQGRVDTIRGQVEAIIADAQEALGSPDPLGQLSGLAPQVTQLQAAVVDLQEFCAAK